MGVQLTTLLILARHRVPFLPAYLASLATGELAAKAWTACEDVHQLAQARRQEAGGAAGAV